MRPADFSQVADDENNVCFSASTWRQSTCNGQYKRLRNRSEGAGQAIEVSDLELTCLLYTRQSRCLTRGTIECVMCVNIYQHL